MTRGSARLADWWLPRRIIMRRSRRRSGSEIGSSGHSVPWVRYWRTRGHRGWPPHKGSRTAAGRNSEPGVRVEKGCALMAASRSMLYLRSTFRLCRAAKGDHANWNSGGLGVGDCQATTVERISRRTNGGIPSTGRGGRSTMGGSSTPTMGWPSHRVPVSAWAWSAGFPATDAQMWLPVITEAGPWWRVVSMLAETGLSVGRPGTSAVGTESASGRGLLMAIGWPRLPSPAPTRASSSWGHARGGGSASPGSGHQGVTGGGDGGLTEVNSPRRESVRSIIWVTPSTPPCKGCPSRCETEGVEDSRGGALGSELYDSREGPSGRPAKRVDHRVS